MATRNDRSVCETDGQSARYVDSGTHAFATVMCPNKHNYTQNQHQDGRVTGWCVDDDSGRRVGMQSTYAIMNNQVCRAKAMLEID